MLVVILLYKVAEEAQRAKMAKLEKRVREHSNKAELIDEDLSNLQAELDELEQLKTDLLSVHSTKPDC